MDNKVFMTVIVPLSILLPIFLGLKKLKSLPFSLGLIWWYLIFTAFFNTISILMARVWHLNNMPLTHLYTLGEFAFFMIWFGQVIDRNRETKLYALIIAGFMLLCLGNIIYFQSIYSYNSYTRSVEAIICIFFCLNFFAKLAAGETEKNAEDKPLFYINCGIFLYFSGAFMLFIFSNFLVTNLSMNDYILIWTLHAVLVLLMYILFSISFLLWKK